MKKVLVAFLLSLYATCAFAQTSETFGNYVNGLPAASSVGSTDQLYLRQGGTSKQVPFSAVTVPGSQITAGSVANSNLASVASGTVKCNPAGGSPGSPEDCTYTRVHSLDFLTAGAVNAQSVSVSVTISASSASLSVGTATFAAGDVGKVITVAGIGTAGAPLRTTIAGFTSPTAITLGAPAVTGVSAATEVIVWGTDNTAGLQNWLNACGNLLCVLDNGQYLITGTLQPSNGALSYTIVGYGRSNSIITQANVSLGIFNFPTTANFVSVKLSDFQLTQYLPQTAAVYLVSLDGVGTEQFGSSIRDMSLIGGYGAIAATNSQDLTVSRNVINSQTNLAIFYDYPLACATGAVKITDNYITSQGGSGIAIGATGGATIQGNAVVQLGALTGNGIELSGTQACLAGDVYIDNNTIESWINAVSWSKGSETGGGANHFTHNDTFGSTNGLIAGDSNSGWLEDLVVEGNHFYCTGECLALTNSVVNASVTGNTFTQTGGTPSGIVVSSTVTGVAKGNTFSGLSLNISNSSPKFYAENLVNGHLLAVGPAPTINSCTGGSIAAGSTDESGSITYTSSDTSCAINFAQTYTAAPKCAASITQGGAVAFIAGATATTLDLTFAATSSTGFAWICKGN